MCWTLDSERGILDRYRVGTGRALYMLRRLFDPISQRLNIVFSVRAPEKQKVHCTSVRTSCTQQMRCSSPPASLRKNTSTSSTPLPRVHPRRTLILVLWGAGIPVPSAPTAALISAEAGVGSGSNTNTNDMDWDPAPNPKQVQLVGPMSSSQTSSFAPAPFSSSGAGSGGGGSSSGAAAGAGIRPGGGLSRRGSGSVFVDKVGITRIPDRAWTIALDYLDLGEVGLVVVVGVGVESYDVFVLCAREGRERGRKDGRR